MIDRDGVCNFAEFPFFSELLLLRLHGNLLSKHFCHIYISLRIRSELILSSINSRHRLLPLGLPVVVHWFIPFVKEFIAYSDGVGTVQLIINIIDSILKLVL